MFWNKYTLRAVLYRSTDYWTSKGHLPSLFKYALIIVSTSRILTDLNILHHRNQPNHNNFKVYIFSFKMTIRLFAPTQQHAHRRHPWNSTSKSPFLMFILVEGNTVECRFRTGSKGRGMMSGVRHDAAAAAACLCTSPFLRMRRRRRRAGWKGRASSKRRKEKDHPSPIYRYLHTAFYFSKK